MKIRQLYVFFEIRSMVFLRYTLFSLNSQVSPKQKLNFLSKKKKERKKNSNHIHDVTHLPLSTNIVKFAQQIVRVPKKEESKRKNEFEAILVTVQRSRNHLAVCPERPSSEQSFFRRSASFTLVFIFPALFLSRAKFFTIDSSFKVWLFLFFWQTHVDRNLPKFE